MIKGLFVSRQYRESVWERDFASSALWNTEKFGIKMDICKGHKKLFKNNLEKVLNEYDFFITEEIWTDKFRKRVLEPIRNNSDKKVFLISQEPFKPDNERMELAYFFRRNYSMGPGDYFFIPDAVLTPGTVVNSWWNNYTTCNTYLTGYPRFDFYSANHPKFDKNEVRKKYGLSADKKLIFFISFGAYMYTEPADLIDPDKDDKNRIEVEAGYLIDLYDSREETLVALNSIAKKHNFQVVVKIHPMSFKAYKDGGGTGKEVAGTLKKYYENPSENMVVIGDEWDNGNISKELLCASDVVCGWGSTMMLEAMMLKKPIINVQFGKTNRLNLYEEFNNIFYTASNVSELDPLLSKELSYVYDENMITKYFYKNDGKTCERACDAIKSELSLKKRMPKIIKEMIPTSMII